MVNREKPQPRDLSREPAVWIAPGRRGGEPCIIGTRVPTEQIAQTVFAGNIRDVLGCWYYITRAQVLVACWYHATRNGRESRIWRERWGGWAQDYGDQIWAGKWDEIPDPPVAAFSGGLGG